MQFNDIKETNSAKAIIQNLSKKKIFIGFKDGSFKPNKNITRAEFVTAFVRALNIKLAKPTKPLFTDVSSKHWANKYINAALEKGIIGANDYKKFMPRGEITRFEVFQIIANSSKKARDIINSSDSLNLSFKDIEKLDLKTKNMIFVLKNAGILKGYKDNTIRLGNKATREEMAMLIDRFLTNKNKLDNFTVEKKEVSSDYFVEGVKFVGLDQLNNSKDGIKMERNKTAKDQTPLDVQLTIKKVSMFKYDKNYKGSYKAIFDKINASKGLFATDYWKKRISNSLFVAIETSSFNTSGHTIAESGMYFEPIFDNGEVEIQRKIDDYCIEKNLQDKCGTNIWLKNNKTHNFIAFFIVDEIPVLNIKLSHHYLTYLNETENGEVLHKDNMQEIGIDLSK